MRKLNFLEWMIIIIVSIFMASIILDAVNDVTNAIKVIQGKQEVPKDHWFIQKTKNR